MDGVPTVVAQIATMAATQFVMQNYEKKLAKIV